MKVVIQKTDLDTCLTALIMGVTGSDKVIISKGDAPEEDSKNPDVLCIEAGGSGQTQWNNFDHHNEGSGLHPACLQAYMAAGKDDAKLKRLVDYVCIVDDRPKDHPNVKFPSLSNLFSGLLFVELNPVAQLFKGMEMLRMVLQDDIDPFDTMPDMEEWKEYKRAKKENMKKVEETLKKAKFHTAASGMKIGYLESDFIGGIGTLYGGGMRFCDNV
ncbi:MAG: hypothetical protein HQK96_09420 [Nitrospirae bacterium]|nr:hypothetical protein [Nitrospirota bacterium]